MENSQALPRATVRVPLQPARQGHRRDRAAGNRQQQQAERAGIDAGARLYQRHMGGPQADPGAVQQEDGGDGPARAVQGGAVGRCEILVRIHGRIIAHAF
jgi:hypothetical protein